ncbi:App1 family protein [Gephyromycinifex aptenodytis]|uniref:App1 family protein n=1 Tax=Gephyromycinifex aptenodytis TaxID=2716227 RepID=UPI00144631D8|nr:phosphatase domain-containing protein [Gephyromycinifex aptenodytis]
MARPHAAALIEDAWNQRMNSVLASRGWKARAVGLTGYGSTEFVRVLGRVLLSRHPNEIGSDVADPEGDDYTMKPSDRVRGWRAFVTAQVMYAPVRIVVAGKEHSARTDRSGYVDVVIEGHDLPPGWHEVTIAAEGGLPVPASVYIVDPAVRFGLVSDIDDTVITTSLPRPLIAAWNTFVRQEQARHIVQGMAPMYRELLADHPGAPIFYLSTGAWNTAGTLTRFLRSHGYPAGPLLLTDWGPTNTGWFRSGQEHKRVNLHRLAREFPQIRWVLVGDDGQHDPKIYGDFARDRPDVVRAIGIRELTAAEQVLSHGIPVSNEGFAARVHRPVPVVRAPDGYGLLPKLRAVLAQS